MAHSMDYVPKYIIVHHSAANTPTPQYDAIDAWHKARGFPQSESGYFVGYHRVIEKDGSVRVARRDGERDADTLGHNFDSLSVCLVGNFDETTPTPAQVDALGALLVEWATRYHIPAGDILPHRHFQNKSCYGSQLGDEWAAIVYLRAFIAQLQAQLDALMRARMRS